MPDVDDAQGLPSIQRLSPGSVEDAAVVRPAPWDLRSRVLAIVSGLGAMVVLAGSLTALANDPLGNAKLAERFPDDVAYYLEVNARGLLDGLPPLLDAFRPLLGEDATTTDELLDQEDEPGGITLRDVLTWATGRAAFAGTADDPSGFGPGGTPAMGIMEGRDAAALDAFLERLVADLAADGDVATEEVDGRTFHVLTPDIPTFAPAGVGGLVDDGTGVLTPVPFVPQPFADVQLWFGRDGGDLLLGTSADAVRRLFDVTAPLSAVGDFTAAVGALPGGADVLFGLDYDGVFAASGMPPEFEQEFRDQLSFLPPGWIAGSLEVTPDAVRATWATASDAGLDPVFGDGRVLRSALPGGAVAYVRVGGSQPFRDVVGAFSQLQFEVVDPFGTDDTPVEAPPPIPPEAEAAINAVADLFAVDGGAVVQVDLDDAEAPVAVTVVGVAASDAEPLVKAALAAISAAEGAPVTIADLEPLAVGTRDNLTILSTDPTVVEAPPSPSMAGDPLLDRARGLVGGEVGFAVDVPRAIAAITALVFAPFSGPAEFSPGVACQPFTVLAASSSRRGAHQVTQLAVGYDRPLDDCGEAPGSPAR